MYLIYVIVEFAIAGIYISRIDGRLDEYTGKATSLEAAEEMLKAAGLKYEVIDAEGKC